MPDLIKEFIHVEEEFKKHPEHFSWIADLNTAWNVIANNQWDTKLLNQKTVSGISPYTQMVPDDNGPGLTNHVFCVGTDGTALSRHFGSPVLVSKDKSRLDGLLDYEIKKVSGEEIKNDLRLSDVFTRFSLPQSTPVYHAVLFLPVPLKGAKYETHFFPMVSTFKYCAANYLLVENNLISAGQVSERFRERPMMIIDKNEKESYIKATFTPDAAADGKIILPKYEGRIIIITVPIKVKKQLTDYITGGNDFRPDSFYDTRHLSLGERKRSAQVDTVSLSKGMESKNQSGYVETEQIFEYSPSIIDIRCLGVRRGIEMMYSPEKVKALFNSAYNVPVLPK